MTDLFSAGFAWQAEDVSQADATPAATRLPAISDPETIDNSHLFGRGVAPVAGVAEGEGAALARRLSQRLSPISATPVATPETADLRGVQADFLPGVASVASVAGWWAGIDHLATLGWMAPPHPATSWRRLIADARAFMQAWGSDAVAAGWSTLDVFGTNPFVRQRRLDRAGLIVLLDGAPVQSLDGATALIGEGRDCLTYRRGPRGAGSVPVWAVKDGSWQ